jgi:hypothetical protein
MAKPKRLYLVKDHDAELRALAVLWRVHARQQVEEELRRKGIRSVNADLNEEVRRWLSDHPRPTWT